MQHGRLEGRAYSDYIPRRIESKATDFRCLAAAARVAIPSHFQASRKINIFHFLPPHHYAILFLLSPNPAMYKCPKITPIQNAPHDKSQPSIA